MTGHRDTHGSERDPEERILTGLPLGGLFGGFEAIAEIQFDGFGVVRVNVFVYTRYQGDDPSRECGTHEAGNSLDC